jgi:cobalt-zinc-cadmium efflux system outer membrane protein
MAVLAAQERLRLAQEAAELGGDLAQAVEAQVEAGRVSPIEGRRARAKRDGLRIAARGLRGDLEQARLFLARTWGGASAGFGRAVGATDALPQLQPLDVLLARRESLPSLKRWGAELARRDAAVELAESNGIPDLTMTLGYRAERRSDDYERSFTAGADGVGIARASTSPDNRWAHSLVLEGSIPLPLFDRNQGRRRVAELEVGKGTDERAVADARIVATLTRFHAAARAARDQAQAIAERVLPELEKTLALTLEGYERGRFDYLAVLDAEEALNGARLQALEARLSYHETVASIEALFGASIATSPDDPGTRKGTNSKTLTVEEDL